MHLRVCFSGAASRTQRRRPRTPSGPKPGHEETLSDTGSGLEATSPRSGCTAPSSACALVFLDHEADAFIFLDGSDLLAAGPVELILDWDLFDDLESPVGFHDMRASTSPCRMALTRFRRKSLHPQRRGLWRPRCSDARGLFRLVASSSFGQRSVGSELTFHALGGEIDLCLLSRRPERPWALSGEKGQSPAKPTTTRP